MGKTKPLVSRRERKKAQLREALIGAAFKLFLKKGYVATTLEDISEACDVTVPTLLRYFASKDDLLFGFHGEILARFERGLHVAVTEKASLAHFTTFFIESSRSVENSREVVNTYKIIEGFPPLLSKFYEIGRRYEELLEQALSEEEGLRAGEDFHSTMLAHMLVTGLISESLRAIGRGDIQTLAERNARMIQYIVENFRRPAERFADKPPRKKPTGRK